MKYLVLVTLLGLSGCSTYRLVSTDKDAWIQTKAEGSDAVLYYCRGNPDDKLAAIPICFKPVYLPARSDVRPPQ